MKTTAIQVVPFIDDTHNDITPQFAGPTEQTTGWAVYERKEDGTAHWFADTGSESRAMWIGNCLCAEYDVEIEPQPWKRRDALTLELTDAYYAQGNQGTFEAWLADMADNPNGTLQNAAKELIALKGQS